MDNRNLNKNLKALLKWRGLNITEENIKNIKQNEITCSYNAFVDFTILRKKLDLDNFRNQYQTKTGESWKIFEKSKRTHEQYKQIFENL